MIDHAHIGHRFAPATATVSEEQLRFFAKATGNKNPLFVDSAVATAAGYDGLPAPPTFTFCLEMMATDEPFELFALLDVDLSRVLHGEQRFVYYIPIVAGDTLRFETRIANVYAKKGGALEFVELTTDVFNQRDELAVQSVKVVVVRGVVDAT